MQCNLIEWNQTIQNSITISMQNHVSYKIRVFNCISISAINHNRRTIIFNVCHFSNLLIFCFSTRNSSVVIIITRQIVTIISKRKIYVIFFCCLFKNICILTNQLRIQKMITILFFKFTIPDRRIFI